MWILTWINFWWECGSPSRSSTSARCVISDIQAHPSARRNRNCAQAEDDLRIAIIEIDGRANATIQSLNAEKVQLQAALNRANGERIRLVHELADLTRRQAGQASAAERSTMRRCPGVSRTSPLKGPGGLWPPTANSKFINACVACAPTDALLFSSSWCERTGVPSSLLAFGMAAVHSRLRDINLCQTALRAPPAMVRPSFRTPGTDAVSVEPFRFPPLIGLSSY